jgi:hypothetical protein
MLLLTIHDNFQYVQNAVQQFYRSKTPMLLLKLDIVKHFDNVGWEYILEILKQMGFDQRWRNMMSLIWSTMTSQVMLNGKLGHPIRHGRGSRQGIPCRPCSL